MVYNRSTLGTALKIFKRHLSSGHHSCEMSIPLLLVWVHDINRNRFLEGTYHNLIKELQFDWEKFQQYFG